jgi:hypothetical protein
MADAPPADAAGAAGAHGGAYTDPTALAARCAQLAQALAGADAAEAEAAATQVRGLAAGERGRSVCEALVSAGVIAPLLRAEPPGAGLWRLRTLAELTGVCPAARRAVHAAGGVTALLHRMQDMHDGGAHARTARTAARVVCNCVVEATVRDACGADAAFHALLLPLLRDGRLQAAAVATLLDTVFVLAEHGDAARTMLAAGWLPVLAALLVRHDGNDANCQSICATLTWLADVSDPPYAALHDAGVYAAALPLLGVTSARSGRPWRVGTALMAAVALLGTAFVLSPPLRPRLRHLLLSQPGALAGVALARRRRAPNLLCKFFRSSTFCLRCSKTRSCDRMPTGGCWIRTLQRLLYWICGARLACSSIHLLRCSWVNSSQIGARQTACTRWRTTCRTKHCRLQCRWQCWQAAMRAFVFCWLAALAWTRS